MVPLVPLTLRIHAPTVSSSESVWVTGDVEALGQWDVSRMVPMEREGEGSDLFRTRVLLPVGCMVEYRYVVWRSGRIDRWESLLGNRKVFPGVRNVARGKSARQSSTYVATGPPVPGPRSPDAAVNGVVHGWAEHMCCHTERGQDPWWEVDLGEPESVVAVQLWNRQDRMVDRIVPFHILLSPEPLPPALGEAQAQSDASHRFSKLKRVFRWDLNQPLAARFVRVQLERDTYLHFAELQVFSRVDMRSAAPGTQLASETSTYSAPPPDCPDAPCSHEVHDGLFGVSPLDAMEEEDPEPKVDSRWLTPHHGSELRILLGARTGIPPVHLFDGQPFTVAASVLGERPEGCEMALLSAEKLRSQAARTAAASSAAGAADTGAAAAHTGGGDRGAPPVLNFGVTKAASPDTNPASTRVRARLASEPLALYDPRTGSMTHPDSDSESEQGSDSGSGSGSASASAEWAMRGSDSETRTSTPSGPDRGRQPHRHVPAAQRDRVPRARGDTSPRRDHIDQEGREMEGMPSVRPYAETINPLAAPLHGEGEGEGEGGAGAVSVDACSSLGPSSIHREGPLPVAQGSPVTDWPAGEVQVFAVAWRKVKRGVRIDVFGPVVEDGTRPLIGEVPLLPSHFVSSRGVIHRPIVASSGVNRPVRIVGEFFAMFIVVSPIDHDSNTLQTSSRILAPPRSVSLDVGHRGLGRSFHQAPGYRKAAIRENTLMSFVTAGKLGADWVEFDVQLSRDRQCVIYHDFHILAAVRESATDMHDEIEIAVHDLPLRQLQRCRIHHVPKTGRLFSRFLRRHQEKFVDALYKRVAERDGQAPQRRSSSRSDDAIGSTSSSPVPFSAGSSNRTMTRPKMAHLLEQVPTLHALFQHVPSHVGFNIEIKYPCEDQHRSLRPLAHFELNRYIDDILREVFDHAGNRRIIFSCFDPDVCTMLRAKQPRYPVLFLTSGGTDIGYRDVRSQSLEAAVQFATSEGLQGIVTESRPLLDCPSLIPVIKESGLLLFTYGDSNTSYEAVRLQKEHGVDAVISDNIGDLTKLAGKAMDDQYALRHRDESPAE